MEELEQGGWSELCAYLYGVCACVRGVVYTVCGVVVQVSIHTQKWTVTLCTLHSVLCTLYSAHGHSAPCLLWDCAVDSGGASCAGVLCATSPKHSV